MRHVTHDFALALGACDTIKQWAIPVGSCRVAGGPGHGYFAGRQNDGTAQAVVERRGHG